MKFMLITTILGLSASLVSATIDLGVLNGNRKCWGRNFFPIPTYFKIFSQSTMPSPETTLFEYLLIPPSPQTLPGSMA